MSTSDHNMPDTNTTTDTQSLCEICPYLYPSDVIIRPICTQKCLYCDKSVCGTCCCRKCEQMPSNKSININPLQFQIPQSSICFECVILDRHQTIMRNLHKHIGNVFDINIINIIAIFCIDECKECNKIYPKSWSIMQYDTLNKLISSMNIKPDNLYTKTNSQKQDNSISDDYALKYCRPCNINHELDIISDSIFPIIIQYTDMNVYNVNDLNNIIDIISSYSIGCIFSCTNIDNCNNTIILNNKYDGLIKRKDINSNIISRSINLSKIYCSKCTNNQNRNDLMREYCSFCDKRTQFGNNITCNGCFDRFCNECIESQNDDIYFDKKYYFDDNNNIYAYLYCNVCIQEIVVDTDYESYQLVDQYYSDEC